MVDRMRPDVGADEVAAMRFSPAVSGSSVGGLAPDARVAARDALLDPDHVVGLLRRFAGDEIDIESCSLRRSKYRIGESLRVVYDVHAGDRNLVMSARTFPDSASVFRDSPEVDPVHGMPGIAHDPDTRTLWWTLPNDRKLHNLGTLLEPPLRVRLSSGVDWDRSMLVEYAPERSATVRIEDSTGHVTGFAKAYRDRDPLEVAVEYNRIATSIALIDGVRTPRALGWARPDRIVVLEPMPGRVWKQLPVDAQSPAMHRFGSALAHVHGLATDSGRGPFQRFRPERVRRSADLVAIARPDVAASVTRLRDALASGPPPSRVQVSLHGDVHANNVLYHGDQVHMIDFDQGGTGTPAADLGSMLASLMTSRSLEPETTAAGVGAAFLAGYQAVRALPPQDELRWFTVAAFVAERAIRAVNRVNQLVLEILPEVLALAEATLAGKVDLGG